MAKLLAVAQEIDEYWLHEPDKKEIQKGLQTLRHSWFSKSCINRHQIGGLLNLVQGHEYIVCPNPDCRHHQMAKQFRGTRMTELAVIHNDPHSGLPMCERLEELSEPTDFNEFIQVVYWVCEECLTITASNRCDSNSCPPTSSIASAFMGRRRGFMRPSPPRTASAPGGQRP